MRSRRHAVAWLAIAMVATLAACARDGDGPSGARRVVATTTQVGSLAREIGGDDVELTVLLRPGVEAHDFELTPEAGAALERADLVLLSGAGLEAWLADTLDAIGATDRQRDMSEGVALRELSEGGDRADAVDPHYWLSGPNAIVMATNVRDALAEAFPDASSAFEERASALIQRLEAADARVRTMLAEVPADRRQLVTDHDALGYFIDEYGLEFFGSVFPSLDVASEPSAQQIEELVAAIRANDVAAVFTETSVNPALARAVADETDARLVDEPLYTDSLGPEGSDADTLDGMLLHNARVIHDGLIGG